MAYKILFRIDKLICGLISICLLVMGVLGCSRESTETAIEIRTDQIAEVPSLAKSTAHYVRPLADAFSRIDPRSDGWDSEAFSEYATSQLKKLAKALGASPESRKEDLDAMFVTGAVTTIHPQEMVSEYIGGGFHVQRSQEFFTSDNSKPFKSIRTLLEPMIRIESIPVELKLFKVEKDPAHDYVDTRIYFHSSGAVPLGRRQLNAEWIIRWTAMNSNAKIESIRSISHEVVDFLTVDSSRLYADATQSVLGENSSYSEQLLYSTDHWRSRLTRDLGLDVIAHHGIAMGDVNGDLLEDLYICQQGGLPNRLFIRNQDGTLTDISEKSGCNWLDFSTSALFGDLDNDGDQDLVVSLDFRIVMMRNDGDGRFEVFAEAATPAQTFSMALADYDLDGDLDLYACGYNPSHDRNKSGAMGEPLPYHDATNGGRNILLHQESLWKFVDVTEKVGLNENNNRFSFAASWVDYDADGDQDLYVANDYGRNNFYINESGVFRDAAAELGVEDMSAGMSVDWADFNRDGSLDIYISNMFSAAGNRITFQRQFRPDLDANTRAKFQRHARGNSLFAGNSGGGEFQDVSQEMGVTMGRWAWASRFTDINNDGWEDIVVANGFISTEDTGDL